MTNENYILAIEQGPVADSLGEKLCNHRAGDIVFLSHEEMELLRNSIALDINTLAKALPPINARIIDDSSR